MEEAPGVLSSAQDDAAESFIRASRALVGMAIRSIASASSEITLPQHRLLVLLANGGAQTIGQLTERLGVDQSNVSRLCDRLQRLGFIERRRSSSDGRAVEIELLAAGRDLLAEVDMHRRVEVQRVLAEMTTAEVRAAVRTLEAFSAAANELGQQTWVVYGH